MHISLRNIRHEYIGMGENHTRSHSYGRFPYTTRSERQNGSIGGKSGKIGFLLILFFFFLPAIAEARLLTLDDDASYNLAPVMEHLTRDGKSSTEEIIQAKDFSPLRAEKVEFGYNNEHHWFRFSLKNRGPGSYWFISLSANPLDWVDLYCKTEDGSMEHKKAGDHRPFSRFDQPYTNPVFRIYLEKEESRSCYLHVKSTSVITFEADVSGPRTFTDKRTWNNIFYGVYFGFAIIYVFYTLYLSWSRKHTTFLYLIPLALSVYFYKFAIGGNTYIFWPESPFFQDRLLLLTAVPIPFSMNMFLIHYLQLRERQPLMHRVSQLVQFVIVLLLYGVFDYNIVFIRIGIWVTIAIVSFFVFITIRAYRMGQTSTKYIMAVWVFFGIAMVIRFFTLLGFIPYHRLGYDASFIQFPAILSLLLISVFDNYRSLSNRYKNLEASYEELREKISVREGKKVHRISGVDVEKCVQRIGELVETDECFYELEFGLNTLAEKLAIRPDQLSQILNQELNTSFTNFLRTIRVHRACRLMMEHPEKNVTEIFLDSGFSSKSPFNIAFREVTGMTPREYRTKFKGLSKPQNDL